MVLEKKNMAWILSSGMKEQVYVRVIAHNQQGWGAPTPSKPSHLAIADDEKAPESSSRSFESAKLFGSFSEKIMCNLAVFANVLLFTT